MNKKELRKWVKEERKNFDINTLSHKLVYKLTETIDYKQAKNIMIFYPKEDEINLLSLLEDKSKNFFLPKINGNNLLCCPYCQYDELYDSVFKTKEPFSEPIEKNLIDLVIIPALAVDKNNYRLGYGGGYYDRFLTDISAKKIVCIPKKFLLETVYPETHDIKIDTIITA